MEYIEILVVLMITACVLRRRGTEAVLLRGKTLYWYFAKQLVADGSCHCAVLLRRTVGFPARWLSMTGDRAGLATRCVSHRTVRGVFARKGGVLLADDSELTVGVSPSL